MGWFNYYGLIAIIIIMVPNILCAIFNKAAFENNFNNKPFQIIEQIGRYGCMLFMVFNIPYTYFGFWFDNAFTVYLSVGGAFLAVYCLGWIIFWKSKSKLKALWLSITPTALFVFCGIVLSSVPLLVCSVIFGVGHITVSYKNG